MKVTLDGEEKMEVAVEEGQKVAVGEGLPVVAAAREDCDVEEGRVHNEEDDDEEEEGKDVKKDDEGGEGDYSNDEVEEQEEVKWAKHYSSAQEILLVGEGDFSFSLSLATSFGSASNIVATSLDSSRAPLDPYFRKVKKKYHKAKSNLTSLKKRGATLLHGIDATKMKLHADLKMRKFDRIIFNFPHAGFKGKEDDMRLINLHKQLVYGFFRNASRMLRRDGEVHISHKTSFPFSHWKLEDLAAKSSLVLFKCYDFKIEDHPGYNNKRGDGVRCDEPFPLGECSTFVFRVGKPLRRKSAASNVPNICGMSSAAALPERNPNFVPVASHDSLPLGTERPPVAGYLNRVPIASHVSRLLVTERPPVAGYPNFMPIAADGFLLLGTERSSTTGYPMLIAPDSCLLGTEGRPTANYIRYVNGWPTVEDSPRQFFLHSRPQLRCATDLEERTCPPRTVIDTLLSELLVDYMLDSRRILGSISPEFRSEVEGILRNSFEVYVNEAPGRTIHEYIAHLQELHHSSILRTAWLRRMLLLRQQLRLPSPHV